MNTSTTSNNKEGGGSLAGSFKSLGNDETYGSCRSQGSLLLPGCEPGGGPTYHRMNYLTSQQQKHRRLLFVVLLPFLTMLVFIAAWRVHLSWEKITGNSDNNHRNYRSYDGSTANNNNNNNNDGNYHPYLPPISPAVQQHIADAGLQRLNSNLNIQEEHIASGCESTLLIIRHCDSTNPFADDDFTDTHCSYLGYERAYYLATLFGTRWPKPDHLYALSLNEGGTNPNAAATSSLEYETLVPLARKIQRDIELVNPVPQRFATETYFNELQSGNMCGKVSIITWRRGHIPDLANALGCGPTNGCPSVFPQNFDDIWQLKYVFNPPHIDFGPIPGLEDLSNSTTTKDNTNQHNRKLKKHHGRHKKNRQQQNTGWSVFASTTKQNFDPLVFSTSVGDYGDDNDQGTTSYGGRWIVDG